MGGWGSGRWQRDDSKATVESCLALDVNYMRRKGMLFPGAGGTLNWTYAGTGKPSASVVYRVVCLPDEEELLRLWLSYRRQDSETIRLPIDLQPMHLHFGGLRYWFICPLLVNGVACRRRVGKLYFCGRYFGCRRCHDLTYRSCQESHQYERHELAIEKMFAHFHGKKAAGNR